MFARPFFFLVALTLGVTVGHAQPSPVPSIPEPCRAASDETLPVLEKRRRDLERGIARQTAVMKTNERKTGVRPPAESLQKSQEDLLEVLFQIDCLNIQLKLQPFESERRRSAQSRSDDVIEVTTYYATNCKQSGSIEPAKFYGPGIESTLQYGRAMVTIPRTHTPGTIEMPSLWKLERQADPRKHFVLKSVIPLNADAARSEMAERLQGLGSKTLLIFVHGYYVGFSDAALRTAQMAHDLKFPGMAFFYSWPSANQVRAYLQDEEAARFSEGVFEQLIEELSQLPVTGIYIVAHSMGTRIVGHALQSRADKGKETKHLREVLLAAPDINADIFRRDIAPKLAAMRDTRTTLYASSSDLALIASKVVHGFRRLGETTGGVFIYPGFETIDASSASPVTRAYGHSYLVDSLSVLKDIQSIIRQRVAAKQRGLSQMGTSPNTYWRLP